MGRNWAIVVGINHYENLRSLKYAKQDAFVMETWFKQEAFEQVFLFTEDSPPIQVNPPIPTQPTFGHMRRFLRAQFEDTQQSLLKPEDNLWFFFAGHGWRYRDQDYLLFSDSDPGDIEKTAISVDYVTQRLRRSGADNVVLFLDACRDEGGRTGLGIGEQSHQGVITFYSCAANQQSWEIDELQHGSFTHTLLEGLRLQGEANCATVERLEQHLRYQVPLLNTHYKKPLQNPYLQAEPPYKMYFILREQAARLRDVESLKYQASIAENRGNLLLARQLWIRVWTSSRSDWEALEAIERIAIRQRENYEHVISSEPLEQLPTGERSITPSLVRESQIAQSQEENQHNLVRYQQDFSDAIKKEFPLTEATRHKLKQLQQSLQLTNDEILHIEQPIVTQKQAENQEHLQQHETRKQNLVRYQQAFSEAIERNFPLSQATRSKLNQWQQSLQLTNDEVAQIEQPLVTQKEAEHERRQEEHRRRHRQQVEDQQKLQQYEQELIKTIEAGNSLDRDDVRQKLRQLQQTLGLKDVDTAAIEAKVIEHRTILLPIRYQPLQTIPLPIVNRRQFLNWARWGGVGLATAVVARKIFMHPKPESTTSEPTSESTSEPTPESTPEPTSESTSEPTSESTSESTPESTPLQSFQFKVVTIDSRGKNINSRPSQAKFFAEDLGNGVTLEIVEIPNGSFIMGSPSGEKGRKGNQESQHAVIVPSFLIGRLEVTQEQYQQVMGSNPSKFKGKKRPVETVSWNDAVLFCENLSQKTKHTYRLPSEAEWEYACRAGTTTPFYFGDTITTDLANYNGNFTYASEPKSKYRQQTTDVGSFPPNAYGLHDMHGNVWEWCADTWHESYQGAPIDGSSWDNGNHQTQVIRGGSWFNEPVICRSGYRNWHKSDSATNDIGFRVVCSSVTKTL